MNEAKHVVLASIVALGMGTLIGSPTLADDPQSPDPAAMAEMAPSPQTEHQWLKRFAGKWESHGKGSFGEGQPTFECKGTQQARILGGFWMIAEGESNMMGTRVQSVLTLGYDPAKGSYVGTWIDSMTNFMWQYVGEVSDDGKTLTLNTEGPNLLQPGTESEYRETIEFKSDDHYVFSSSMKTDGGEWLTFMTVDFRRVK